MTVNALLQRSELHDSVNVDFFWLPHQPFNRDRPRTSAEICCQPIGLVLIGAEFVVIVVIGNVLERGWLLSDAERALCNARQFGSGCFRLITVHAAEIETGGNGRSRGRRSGNEFAPIQESRLGSDL